MQKIKTNKEIKAYHKNLKSFQISLLKKELKFIIKLLKNLNNMLN